MSETEEIAKAIQDLKDTIHLLTIFATIFSAGIAIAFLIVFGARKQ